MDLTNEIRTGTCSFLPKTLEISPIESRFYFQNHMYKMLKDQMLDQYVMYSVVYIMRLLLRSDVCCLL